MGISQYDPAALGLPAWNAGKQVGVKKPLKQRQIWAARFFLDREGRMTDRALFDLAIDSKLRGFDLVKIKIGPPSRATKFELAPWSSSRRPDARYNSRLRLKSGQVCLPGFGEGEEQSMTMPFQAKSTTPLISVLANTPDWSMSGSLQLGSVGRITARTPFGERRLP